MLMNPGKKIPTLIVSKPGATDEAKSVEGGESDVDMGLESAMEDFLKALEAKDASGMASALKDFNYLCEEKEEEGPSEPELEE
jgi:hypothetical protein